MLFETCDHGQIVKFLDVLISDLLNILLEVLPHALRTDNKAIISDGELKGNSPFER